MELVQEFDRTRVEVGGRKVTITSWFETETQRWRGSAPAFLHLLADTSPQQLSGPTRDKAIAVVSGIVAQRLAHA